MNTIISSKQQVIGFVGWVVICFAASAVGALASIKAQSIYGELIQPAWAPPGWLFGPVWTLLYAMMAVAAWLIWRRGGFTENRKGLTWFFIQLVLNGLWSWLFFAWLQGLWSFVNIVLLWMSILATIIIFWRTNRLAGALMVPYILWVSFAAVLNFAMWQLNPSLLS